MVFKCRYLRSCLTCTVKFPKWVSGQVWTQPLCIVLFRILLYTTPYKTLTILWYPHLYLSFPASPLPSPAARPPPYISSVFFVKCVCVRCGWGWWVGETLNLCLLFFHLRSSPHWHMGPIVLLGYWIAVISRLSAIHIGIRLSQIDKCQVPT